MEFTAQEIADLIKGTIEGRPDVVVHDVSKIEDGRPGTLSFLANPKYTHYLYSTQASVVIINNDFNLNGDKNPDTTLIRTPDAYSAFAKLLATYNKRREPQAGIADTSIVSAKAQIGKDVYIGEYVVIEEGAIIGDGVQLYPHTYIGQDTSIGNGTKLYIGVKIYHDCHIGQNCTIHAGTVIGSDGFGFAPQQEQDYKKIPQIGNVIIEDNVEIGTNCTIDRATMGSTLIRKGVKLDNLIQVAHNVYIGENTVIAAQSGISGSSSIGSNCMLGGQVGIAGHLEIADEVKIGAQSGISNHIREKGATVLGSPAYDISAFKRAFTYFRNLPKIVKRIDWLEKKLKDQQENK
ncbi:MAG: UDP-3-O-(3-hydroxymyristoyl)glucosamine N-acyltransferase [Bacteroidales bacterium]|nr:UDP-3-O-(3-hydroxymyristoyl)glucosamine N-acyltransferase [Bacteroidales bacterium]MCF8333900.1 UDP-3-O-(3-hydroxymyristoyl)glucosamine N-acyltransferase [Bacteroidales bacterium]